MKKKLLIITGLITITMLIISLVSILAFNETKPNNETVARAQTVTIDDVANLRVKEIGNESVTIEWDAMSEATGYKILYGTKSVGDNEEYNRPAIDVSTVNSFKVDKLSNGVTYYFSVIAMRGTEHSEFYSNEISAIPSSEGNLAAPTIVSVNPLSSISFEIVFSKPIQLPTNAKAEITVTKAFDETSLMVQSVTSTSPEKITVITDAQSVGSEYRLTLTDKFKDLNGVSMAQIERSDVFIGFSGAAGSSIGAGTTSDIKIKEIKNVSDSSIELVFSKGVKLGAKPTDQIAILESSNPDAALEVRDVVANSNEATKVLVVTDKQKAVNYTILVTGVSDEAGALISQENSTLEFKGFGSETTTATTPESTTTSETPSEPKTEDALPETGPGGLIALFGASMLLARRLVSVPKM